MDIKRCRIDLVADLILGTARKSQGVHPIFHTGIGVLARLGQAGGGLYQSYTATRFKTSSPCFMKNKPFLESSDVKKIALAAEAEALKNNWAVTIAIVDDGGHLLHLNRLDGAPAISSYIGPAKARTSALGRRDSKVYEDIINGGRHAFLSAPEIEGMLEGGVAILKDGQCLGAVGVSGVKSSEDAQIARAGISALGL